MVKIKVTVEPCVAEYITSKFFDPDYETVRFPSDMDIYVVIYDLLQKRPADRPVDSGNLEFMLPDRRIGKDPESYNWLSEKSQRILSSRLRLMMCAELHEYLDENKHLHGIQYKESVYRFILRYDITSIGEDALLKNYQRWRDKQRRRKKREYIRKNRQK